MDTRGTTGSLPALAGAARRHGVAWVAVLLVVVATWSPRLDGPIDLRWDGAAYFMLGTSLAQGTGYRMTSEPGAPPSTLHPPFLPVVVAAVEQGLGSTDPVVVGRALRGWMFATSLLLGLAVYAFLARHLRRRFAVAGAFIGAVQPQFVYCSDSLYAEPFFTLFVVLAVLLHDRKARVARVGSTLLAWLAYAARSAGIAFLAASVLDAWRRRGLLAGGIALALAAVPVLAWTSWIRTAEASPERATPAYAYQTAPYVYFNVSYTRNLFAFEDPFRPESGPLTTRGFARRLASNAVALPVDIGRAVSGWEAPVAVAWALALVVLAGFVLLLRRGAWLVLGFVALSLAAIAITPFPRQFPRYLLPLFPFFALAFFLALQRIESSALFGAGRRARLGRQALVAGAVAMAAVPALSGTVRMFRSYHDPVAYEGRDGRPVAYRLFHHGTSGPAFEAAIDDLRRRAGPDDVIAATDPHWVHVRTGRRAVLPPFELDPATAQRLVDSVPVRYVVADTMPSSFLFGAYQRYTAALVGGNPSRWRTVWTSQDGRVAIHEAVR